MEGAVKEVKLLEDTQKKENKANGWDVEESHEGHGWSLEELSLERVMGGGCRSAESHWRGPGTHNP